MLKLTFMSRKAVFGVLVLGSDVAQRTKMHEQMGDEADLSGSPWRQS